MGLRALIDRQRDSEPGTAGLPPRRRNAGAMRAGVPCGASGASALGQRQQRIGKAAKRSSRSKSKDKTGQEHNKSNNKQTDRQDSR